MKGHILDYSVQSNSGIIFGDDNQRRCRRWLFGLSSDAQTAAIAATTLRQRPGPFQSRLCHCERSVAISHQKQGPYEKTSPPGEIATSLSSSQ